MLRALFLLFACGGTAIHAQGLSLIVVPNVTASALKGVVHDSNGAPVTNASVVLFACPAGSFLRGNVEHSKVLERQQANADGSFQFAWRSHQRLCLQFRSAGFDPLQIEVRYSKSAGELKPVLVTST